MIAKIDETAYTVILNGDEPPAITQLVLETFGDTGLAMLGQLQTGKRVFVSQAAKDRTNFRCCSARRTPKLRRIKCAIEKLVPEIEDLGHGVVPPGSNRSRNWLGR